MRKRKNCGTQEKRKRRENIGKCGKRKNCGKQEKRKRRESSGKHEKRQKKTRKNCEKRKKKKPASQFSKMPKYIKIQLQFLFSSRKKKGIGGF